MVENELRIYNINLRKTLKALAELGFEEKEIQFQENYFLKQKLYLITNQYIRIRIIRSDNKKIVTFTTKQEIESNDGIHTRQEYEVGIEDEKTFIQAMQLIGFEINQCINKKRIILSKEGFANINIDIFDEQNKYIEIEHYDIDLIRKTQRLFADRDIYNEIN